MYCDETYSWSQSGPLKTTFTGVEMFKKILDHGEVMVLKVDHAIFLIDAGPCTYNSLCACW